MRLLKRLVRLLKRFDECVRDRAHDFLNALEYRIAPFTLAAILAVLAYSLVAWDSWRGEESNGIAIRNLILVIAAIAALPLAIWRSKVAEHQSETAQRGLLNERYQKGVDKLGSEKLFDRVSGIYALKLLARENPRDYHVQIMGLLCAFLRHTARKSGEVAESINDNASTQLSGSNSDQVKVGVDVQEAVIVVCHRSDVQIEIEKIVEFRLNLIGADLSVTNLAGANLVGADLWGVNLTRSFLLGADLSGANLISANLTSAKLMRANLTGAYLLSVNLTGAYLGSANLTGAEISICKGFTQKQIDLGTADADNPPDLGGAADAETGKPLVWRGKVAKQT